MLNAKSKPPVWKLFVFVAQFGDISGSPVCPATTTYSPQCQAERVNSDPVRFITPTSSFPSDNYKMLVKRIHIGQKAVMWSSVGNTVTFLQDMSLERL